MRRLRSLDLLDRNVETDLPGAGSAIRQSVEQTNVSLPADHPAATPWGGEKLGRCTYKKALQIFEPYKLAQEANESARDSMRRIAERSIRLGQQAFLLVNNRRERSAPTTIEPVVERIEVGGVQTVTAIPVE